MRKKCKAKIWRGFSWYSCRNTAVTPAGYCRVHDPNEKARRARKRGPTQAELDRREKRRQRRLAEIVDTSLPMLEMVIDRLRNVPGSELVVTRLQNMVTDIKETD